MERCDILRDARVVPQRGDNSCLFHTLSFCLSYDGIVPNIHDDMSGFVCGSRFVVTSAITKMWLSVFLQMSNGHYLRLLEWTGLRLSVTAPKC